MHPNSVNASLEFASITMAESFRVFVHPGTIKHGYLTKSPPLEKKKSSQIVNFKGWKKRWCIFVMAGGSEPFLHYYHSEEEAMHGLPIKRVSLSDCSKVEINLKHSSFRNIFAIHLPERVYYFSAPSLTEMSEWVDALCAHLRLGGSNLNPHQPSSPATMPLTPPTLRSAPLYDTSLMSRSLPRLPSSQQSTSPLFYRPPPPDFPLPPVPTDPWSTLPPPPREPLPPIPSLRGGRLSPNLPRSRDPSPPPPPHRSSSRPPAPLPRDESPPPPPPARSVSTTVPPILCLDENLSPSHGTGSHKKDQLSSTSSDEDQDLPDAPPTPPPRHQDVTNHSLPGNIYVTS